MAEANNGGVMATGVPRPAFTAELLADLHADNVAPEQRAQLWPAVAHDPQALRYLRSLDEVSAELCALGRDERIIHAMPADVAARLTQFVDDLDSPEGPTARDAVIHSLRSVPTDESDEKSTASESALAQPMAEHRRGRVRWLAAAAAAILAVAGVGGVVSTLRGGDGTAPSTAQPSTGNDDAGEELTAAVALTALGRHSVTGSLANPAALDRCVRANGLDRTVLGSTDITFQGGNAVLILLSGPRPPTITALVVGTNCGTGDPQRRAVQDIG
ncbi:hypothetical protein IU459_00685 [Nocardia amamiensis]|uniref:Anti-sigma-M factor RsmA n=1 Tax=Nocardia amamiensis TaxID=404578 RepID=A0ABS0CHG5_9NOCA|nr:hypothetical protein [Nocardia amamiensis]MBF6296055.1 hypothetical protein [Nocardia amamiensis]